MVLFVVQQDKYRKVMDTRQIKNERGRKREKGKGRFMGWCM